MPLFDYKCTECGIVKEVLVRTSSEDPTPSVECDLCRAPSKLMAPKCAFVLHGFDWPGKGNTVDIETD